MSNNPLSAVDSNPALQAALAQYQASKAAAANNPTAAPTAAQIAAAAAQLQGPNGSYTTPEGDKYSITTTSNGSPQAYTQAQQAAMLANLNNNIAKGESTPYTAPTIAPTAASKSSAVSGLEKQGFTPTAATTLENSLTTPTAVSKINTLTGAGKSNAAALDPQIVADLNNNNFTGAYQLAGQQIGGMGGAFSNNAGASNPNGSNANLYDQLNTASGLQALDPSKQWTQAEMNAYYQAALNPATRSQYSNGVDPDSMLNAQTGAGEYQQWDANNNIAAEEAANAKSGSYIPNIAGYTSNQGDTGNSFLDKLGSTYLPAIDIAGIAAVTGGATSAALGGGLGGAVAGGAVAGGTGTTLTDLQNNQPITLGGVGKGIGMGALTGAVGYGAKPLTGALSSATGLGDTASSALVKGAIGAGVGAIGGGLNGTGAGTGAIIGGASGAASGAISGSMGDPSSTLAKIASGVGGTIAGALAGKYLAPTPKPVTYPTPAPVAAPAAAKPVAAPVATVAPKAPVATTASASSPTTTSSNSNIGAYSGFDSTGLGYQPRTQVNPNITNYNTYGQGPEATFYQPTPGT